MVHVVNNSSNYGYGLGYREINQQLAKDNGELKHQLSMAASEIAHQRAEVHRRDVEILDLNRQIKELKQVRSKYNAIREIILDKGPVESIHHLEASIRAIDQGHQPLEDDDDTHPVASGSTKENTRTPARSLLSSQISTPSLSDEDEDKDSSSSTISAEETANSTFEANNSENHQENGLDRISERSEESSGSPSPTHSSSPSSTSTSSSNNKVHSQQPIDDSLEPPEVTSVPPIQPERTMHTPSIWNCLDPLDSQGDQSQTKNQDDQDETKKDQDKRDDQMDNSKHDEEQHEQPQHSHIQPQPSPSSNAGLRVSNNINASSPIQPITRKGNHLLADCMFQSTPVLKQREPSIGISPIREPQKDNQENVGTVQPSESTSIVIKPPPANKGRGKRQKPVNREVSFNEEPSKATRYNLRKRTKV